MRHHWLVCSLLGLLAGALGWLAGALFGSNLGRVVLASAAIAGVVALLAGRPRLALASALATAAAASGAFLLGRTAVTPLIAWPVAGLVIGLGGVALFRRRRARVVTVLATPVLGSLGALLGIAATVFVGMARNDADVVGQFLWGGAAGFGLMTLATIRLGARLDRVAGTGGAA